MSDRHNALQLGAFLFEQIERCGIQAEKLGHLAQGTMQRIAEVQGFRQRLADRIQYQELAIAPPDFGFRMLPFSNVQQEPLIGGNIARGILDRNRRLQHGAYLAVLAPHFKFEVGHRAVLLQEFLEPFAVRATGIESGGNIYRQQLIAIFIAGHAKKRIVKIQESSLGRGDKYALLNAGHQRAILFLRALSVSNIFQDVHGSELQSTWIRKRRLGSQEVARQPRISFVAFSADSLAIRANLVARVLDREEFRDASAYKSTSLAPQEL